MKRFKKAISVVSALAMSLSVWCAMPAVQAEDAEIYGWLRYTANTETSAANVVESGAIGETTVTPSSGSRMLEMKVGNKEAQCIYVSDKLPAGDYTISFDVIDPTKVEWRGYAKLGYKYLGTSSPNGCFARIGEAYKGTRTVLDNGWTRFSDIYTLTSNTDGVWDGKTNNIVIGLLGNTDASAVIYIDNVSVKDADGNEYVINGGFELDPPAPEPEPDVITENIVGWARSAENTETTASNVVTTGANVTPIGGSRMLEIKTGPKVDANVEHYVYVPVKLGAGEYTMTFDVNYPSNAGWSGYAKMGYKPLGKDGSGKLERIGKTSDGKDLVGTREELSNGWIRMSQTITLSSDTDGILNNLTNCAVIGINNPDAADKVIYIDNVSVKDASGNEYVTNGDFETVDPLAFSDYTLSIDGVDVDTTTLVNGDATAKVSVKNNNTTDINAQLIVASYASDNSLLNVAVSEVKAIPGGETKVVYTTVPVTVGDNASKVKVFLWDSLDEMTSLKDMQEYTK